MLKKLLLILLLPLSAWAQKQSGGVNFTPSWNYKGTDSLATYQINNNISSPQQWPFIFTRAQFNKFGLKWTDTLNKIGTKSDAKINGALPTGNLGQIIKVNKDLTNQYQTYDPTLYGNYVSTQAQLDSAKLTFVSQLDIFNNWPRFAFGGRTGSPTMGAINDSIPSVNMATNSWRYNNIDQRIESTFNTGSWIGMYSPETYKSYTHTVTLGSNASPDDNDNIGVVIAFVEDKSNLVLNHAYGEDPSLYNWKINTTDMFVPDQHAICLYRQRNGATNSYYITYDRGRSGAKNIADGSSLLSYNPTTNWGANTVDVKVERSGDTIRVYTTEMSDAPGGKGALGHMLQFTLNDLPELSRFKSGSAYGYTCNSQQNSFFTDIIFSGAGVNNIYDLRNGDVWVSNDVGVYTVDPSRNVYTETPEKQRLFNKTTKYEYEVENGIYTTIVTPGVSTGGGEIIPTNGLQKISGVKDSVGLGGTLTQDAPIISPGGHYIDIVTLNGSNASEWVITPTTIGAGTSFAAGTGTNGFTGTATSARLYRQSFISPSPLQYIDISDPAIMVQDQRNHKGIQYDSLSITHSAYRYWSLVDRGYVDSTTIAKADTSIYKFHPLPFNLSTAGYYNATAFVQNNIYTDPLDNSQYATFITPNGLYIGKRTIADKAWQTVKIDSLLGSEIVDSNLDPDGHGVISICMDADGYIHLSGNEHMIPLKYFKSKVPRDITGWATGTMVGTEESSVSYPRFFKNNSGQLFFYYRQGGAGTGDTYLNKYDVSTKTWARVCQLTQGVDGAATYNFYENTPVFDLNGRLHISGTWRSPGGGNFNQDLDYFYSDDNGTTWKNTAGTTYTLPITRSTSTPVLSTGTGVGLINQNGAAVDNTGRYFLLITYNDIHGNTQLFRFYLTGTTWTQTAMTNYNSGTWLPGLESDGKFSRASLFSYNGTTYAIYSQRFDPATEKTGIRIIDLTPEHTPIDVPLLTVDLGNYEMTYDPVKMQSGILSALLAYVPVGNIHDESPALGTVMDFDLKKISLIQSSSKLAEKASSDIGYVNPALNFYAYYTKRKSDARYHVLGLPDVLNYTAQQPAGFDLNNVTCNCTVYVPVTSVNSPTGVVGMVTAHFGENGFGEQEFTRLSVNDGVYRRTRNGGTWTAWTQLASQAFVKQTVATATDANYTIAIANSINNLPVITANRTITMPNLTASLGRTVIVNNKNTSGFTWSFATTVKRANGTTITSIPNGSTYTFDSDGNAWTLRASDPAIGATTGTVTNVATGYGLSGGPITATGTLLADTATSTGLVAKPRLASEMALKLSNNDTSKFVTINGLATRGSTYWGGLTSTNTWTGLGNIFKGGNVSIQQTATGSNGRIFFDDLSIGGSTSIMPRITTAGYHGGHILRQATSGTADRYITDMDNVYSSGIPKWNATGDLTQAIAGTDYVDPSSILTASATLDFPSTGGDSNSTLTITVTGAAIGDVVSLGIANSSIVTQNSSFVAWVSAANTVSVRFNNNDTLNAADPASGVFKVKIFK